MLKLICYLRNYKKESIIAPLFKFLEACFELFVPLVMTSIIDVGVKQGDKTHILRLGGVLVLLGIVGLACSLTAQYFAAKAAAGFGAELRSSMYAHVNSLSYKELDTVGTSSLVMRMTADVDQVQSCVNMILRIFLRSPFIVLGTIVMAFFINARLAVIFMITIPILSLILYFVIKFTIPYYKRVQAKFDGITQITRENLSGIRVIRSFGREADERRRFGKAEEELVGEQLRAGRISALMNPATYAAVNAGIAAIIWFGGKTVDIGGITQGEVIALVNYMSRVLLALVAVVNLIVIFTKAAASAARINEILALRPSMCDAAAAAANSNLPAAEFSGAYAQEEEPASRKNGVSAELKNVSFAYHEGTEVLERISIRTEAGETVGIIGGTGSGKTALVNLICRFYDPTSGEVYIDGKNVKDYSRTKLNSMIAIVPQKSVLFKGTIRSNMTAEKQDASDAEIERALEIAQAADFVRKKDGGLDSTVAQGGKNFSGGQRQRLAIARAIVSSPKLLILDDSASALDYATDAALRRAIRQNIRCTLFIVSQRVSSIRNADRIIVLDDGKTVGVGTHAELYASCGIYREICLSQLSEKEAGNAENN